MINKIKNIIIKKNLDGYLVPKNDKYFTEYAKISNLELVSNFSGSAGFAIILRNKNYLFVDGRYTIQAKKQSGKKFKIFEIPLIWPRNIFASYKNKINIGFDPKLFTYNSLKHYFSNTCYLTPVNEELFYKKNNKSFNTNKFYSLDKKITAFNVGVNAGADSGQSIMHCHIHLIPRRKGDIENPRGGVRGVIPSKQKYIR